MHILVEELKGKPNIKLENDFKGFGAWYMIQF
jgi:hypothetical protein